MRILEFKEFKEDPKLQILMRGAIGLTSKSDDEVVELMEILYDDWINVVLIEDDDGYSTDKKVPKNRLGNKIDFSMPFLSLTSSMHKDLRNPKAKFYNQLKDYEISTDKVKFSKAFKDSKFLPKTVFSLDDIDELTFPIIAKPNSGHSAVGIELFETKEKALASKMKFDLWSNAVDIKTEFRLFILGGEIIHLAERIKNIDNDQSVGVKKANDKIDLVYIDQNFDTLPKEMKSKLIALHNDVKKKVKLDFYDIDLILDTDGEFWIPEINGAPGVGPSMFYSIYVAWIKMIYSRDIKDKTKKILGDIRDEHIAFMKKKYAKEYKASFNPI